MKLYPKLLSMCYDRSYNLDHSDHVRFRRGNVEVLVEHQLGIEHVFFVISLLYTSKIFLVVKVIR